MSTVKSYHSYKLRLLHELRDTNLSYLSKDKKDKKVCITVRIEDFNKHVLFWQITEEVCTPLRENLFEKRINDENRKYFLETTEIWNVKPSDTIQAQN